MGLNCVYSSKISQGSLSCLNGNDVRCIDFLIRELFVGVEVLLEETHDGRMDRCFLPMNFCRRVLLVGPTANLFFGLHLRAFASIGDDESIER